MLVRSCPSTKFYSALHVSLKLVLLEEAWWVGRLSFRWSKKSQFVQLNQSLGCKQKILLAYRGLPDYFSLILTCIQSLAITSSQVFIIYFLIFYSAICLACSPTNTIRLLMHMPCLSEWHIFGHSLVCRSPFDPYSFCGWKKTLQVPLRDWYRLNFWNSVCCGRCLPYSVTQL